MSIYRIIPARRFINKKAFTLVEVMIAAFISLYTIAAVVAAYVVFWLWWHETSPEVEAQRVARVAISTVVNGNVDATAGTYTVGSAIYRRRNGIIQATGIPTLPSSQAINFRLEPDASNCRTYYLGVDPASGNNVLYYKNSSNEVTEIKSTIGISNLTFEKFNGQNNMITVTATCDWNVLGTAGTPRHIYVQYSQLVCLKNVQP